MNRYQIKVERDQLGKFFQFRSLGILALNAIGCIQGVDDLNLEEETGCYAVVSYTWCGQSDFMGIDEHLARFWLCRVA